MPNLINPLTPRFAHRFSNVATRTPVRSWRYAKPVPFPAAGRVAWFLERDGAGYVYWAGDEVGSEGRLELLDFECFSRMSEDYAQQLLVFVTDGVSSAYMGCTMPDHMQPDGGGQQYSAIFAFDWNLNVATMSTDLVARSGGVVSHFSVEDPWRAIHSSSNDPFGEILWTVNGRAMYLDQGNDGSEMKLGGPLTRPSRSVPRE